MTTATQPTFVVSDWKKFEKNTLRGFFTVTLPSGMAIHNLSLHVKEDARWIGMPSQKYVAKSGEVSYTHIVEFTSREAADKFRDAVLEAIDAAWAAQ